MISRLERKTGFLLFLLAIALIAQDQPLNIKTNSVIYLVHTQKNF